MVVLCMLHFLVSTVTFPLVSMLHFLVSTVTFRWLYIKVVELFSIACCLSFQLLHITLDEDINKGRFGYGSSPAYSESFVRPWSTVDPTWRAYCYSSSESFFISPETLWEVCYLITTMISFNVFFCTYLKRYSFGLWSIPSVWSAVFSPFRDVCSFSEKYNSVWPVPFLKEMMYGACHRTSNFSMNVLAYALSKESFCSW